MPIFTGRSLIKMPKAKDCLESNKQDDYQIRYSLLLVARICSYFSNWGGGGLQALRTTITFGSCLCPWVDNTQLRLVPDTWNLEVSEIGGRSVDT